MDDGALRYELETVVVDVPEERPSRPRTVTGELTVQILTGGCWHRRTPDLRTTACGQTFHAQFTPTRLESHVGPLCTECFTAYEQDQSARIFKAEREWTK
jgi:hypothetical protein